jgi:hypothetical protein
MMRLRGVCITSLCPLQGASAVPRGGSAAARPRAPLARMHSKPHQPSAARPPTTPCLYLASPAWCTSRFCRCVSCALCENLRAPNWLACPVPGAATSGCRPFISRIRPGVRRCARPLPRHPTPWRSRLQCHLLPNDLESTRRSWIWSWRCWLQCCWRHAGLGVHSK